MKKRKCFNMSGIDKATLWVLYVDKAYRINEIATITGKTRQRVWQLLKDYGMWNEGRNRIRKVCLYCNKEFQVVKSRVKRDSGKYCNDKCYFEHKASFGHNPSRQGQRIARRTIELWLGHPLPEGFIVHHEDSDCTNNDINNLLVFPNGSEHVKYHHAKRNGTATKPYQELWELPDKIEEWVKYNA